MSPQNAERRYFTVDEANTYIPVLEKWLTTMRHYRQRMEALREGIESVLAKVHLNSGGREASDFAVALHQFQAMDARIREEGIVLRDVESGLLDFPAWHADREVFLCWRSGEPSVEHWHELQAGYAGRKPLDDLDDEEDPQPKSAADEV